VKHVFESRRSGLVRGSTLVLFLLAAAVAGCGDDAQAEGAAGGGGPGGAGGPPASVVKVASVELETVGLRREVPGDLRAKQRSAVATVEAGRVIEVRFDEADVVAEGDVLVVLDDRRLREDLSAAEAEVAVAEAAVRRREAEATQLREEADAQQAASRNMPGSVSQIALRQAQTAADVADAEVNAAQKQLAAARTRVDRVNVQLEDVAVKAPFDGVILERVAEVGEFLQAGASVATLSSTGTFEAVIEVPESIGLSLITAAGPEDVSILVSTTGLRLVPVALRVVPELDARSRRYTVVADVFSDDPSRPLASGMSVTATLPASGEVERLVVPVDAIQRDPAGDYVRMIVPGQFGQSAVPVGVKVQFRLGDRAVLSENPQLRPGVSVVVEGGERLRPGMPVDPREDGASGPPEQAES
jgi:RND family efflux transporter MFP subunit